MPTDLVQRRTFVAVVEARHLRCSAERLYITQTATSNHSRGVEESLDTHQFVRTSRVLELTRARPMLLQRDRHAQRRDRPGTAQHAFSGEFRSGCTLMSGSRGMSAAHLWAGPGRRT